MQQAIKAYNISRSYRFFITCCKCCCKERYQKLQRHFFYDKWLKVKKAALPDQIQWQNIGFTKGSRRFRKAIIWLIAIILIFAGILGVVYFKYQTDLLKEEF